MAKIQRIEDPWNSLSALRVTKRKAHKKGKGTVNARLRVRCGCCDEAVEIYYDENAKTEPLLTGTLEINGVYGTIRQWRKILCPLLLIANPDDKSKPQT